MPDKEISVIEEMAEIKPALLRLAKLSFQINLVPVALAIVFAGINLYLGIVVKKNPDEIGFAMLLIAAMPCEFFYFRQSRNEFLRWRVWGWIYCATINIVWTIAFMASFLMLGVLYSLIFLSVSIYALYLIWQSGIAKERW